MDLAKLGDRVVCNCKGGPHRIVTGAPTALVDGVPIARVDDKSSCGASILAGVDWYTVDGMATAINGSATSCGGHVVAGSSAVTGSPSGSGASSRVAQAALAGEGGSPVSGGNSTTDATASATNPSNTGRAPYRIPAGSDYWPPYNPLTRETLNVEYVRPAVDIAVLSYEEAKEFLENLWVEHEGKGNIGILWQLGSGVEHTRDAYHVAKGLGGLGWA